MRPGAYQGKLAVAAPAASSNSISSCAAARTGSSALAPLTASALAAEPATYPDQRHAQTGQPRRSCFPANRSAIRRFTCRKQPRRHHLIHPSTPAGPHPPWQRPERSYWADDQSARIDQDQPGPEAARPRPRMPAPAHRRRGPLPRQVRLCQWLPAGRADHQGLPVHRRRHGHGRWAPGRTNGRSGDTTLKARRPGGDIRRLCDLSGLTVGDAERSGWRSSPSRSRTPSQH